MPDNPATKAPTPRRAAELLLADAPRVEVWLADAAGAELPASVDDPLPSGYRRAGVAELGGSRDRGGFAVSFPVRWIEYGPGPGPRTATAYAVVVRAELDDGRALGVMAHARWADVGEFVAHPDVAGVAVRWYFQVPAAA